MRGLTGRREEAVKREYLRRDVREGLSGREERSDLGRPVEIEGSSEDDKLEMVEEDFEQDLSVALLLGHGSESETDEEHHQHNRNQENHHHHSDVLGLRGASRALE